MKRKEDLEKLTFTWNSEGKSSRERKQQVTYLMSE